MAEIRYAVGDRTIVAEDAKLIPIYIMGKGYEVPETLTIMKALEYAGYRLIRSCGCRGGICGACVTVYRTAGDYRLKFGLACQTVIEPHMYLVQIPFVPANKATYNIDQLSPDIFTIEKLYPETFRCLACNTCTKACPMDIPVMDCIQSLIQGDIKKCAELSHACIMCGMCSLRCPAELQHPFVTLLARRLYGRYLTPKAKHLEKRIEQIKKGRFDWMLYELMEVSLKDLRKHYAEREFEPEPYDPDWHPKEKMYLIIEEQTA